ncbi:hypothetical protein [Antribacter gilvus]|uniref:hypothetical protein n=1 Tax=Antribacter gilvus TaxID=2304675 RepID=UPI000F79771C|nr:hypothetical protein [Antribacter gilvus]
MPRTTNVPVLTTSGRWAAHFVRGLAAATAVLALGLASTAPAAAEAVPPDAPTTLRLSTDACGAELVSYSFRHDTLLVSARFSHPSDAPLKGHFELVDPVDGDVVRSDGGASEGHSGFWLDYLPRSAELTDGRWILRAWASLMEDPSVVGPALECTIDLAVLPALPKIAPVFGEPAVYMSGAAGGVGVAGAFHFSDIGDGQAELFEYGFGATAAESQASLTSIPIGPTATAPFVPAASGEMVLSVRSVGPDGQRSGFALHTFRVADQAVATPSPVTVQDVEDSVAEDGQVPVAVTLTKQAVTPVGHYTVRRGDVVLAETDVDAWTETVQLPVAALAAGLNPIQVDFRTYTGGPVATTEVVACKDSCAFTGGEVTLRQAQGAQLYAWAQDFSPQGSPRTYQWLRDGQPIQGATHELYTTAPWDEGRSITVAVTAHRARFADGVVTSRPYVVPDTADPSVSYSLAYRDGGVSGSASNGATAGDLASPRPAEGLTVATTQGRYDGSSYVGTGLNVDAYVQKLGWLPTQVGGSVYAGTDGQGLRLEAIRLTANDSDDSSLGGFYDVYYRVHVSGLGWLGWAKNGEPAGTIGYASAVEGLQVRLVSKREPAPAGSGLAAFYDKSVQSKLQVSAHVQSFGWQAPVIGGQTAGTTGLAKRVEALRFGLAPGVSGGIEAQAHVQTYGWMPYVGTGGVVGTEGEAKRVEAFRIRLTGQLAEQYDVYYRTHAEKFGWLGWAKNDEPSGTAGFAYRLEAVQVMLVPKGDPAPSGTGTAYHQQ